MGEYESIRVHDGAEAMVPTGGADADALVTALHDGERRAVAARHLTGRGR